MVCQDILYNKKDYLLSKYSDTGETIYFYLVKIIYLSFSLKSFVRDDQWFLNCKICSLYIIQWIAHIYVYICVCVCVCMHTYILSHSVVSNSLQPDGL